jgi:hypothetical protein
MAFNKKQKAAVMAASMLWMWSENCSEDEEWSASRMEECLLSIELGLRFFDIPHEIIFQEIKDLRISLQQDVLDIAIDQFLDATQPDDVQTIDTPRERT